MLNYHNILGEEYLGINSFKKHSKMFRKIELEIFFLFFFGSNLENTNLCIASALKMFTFY